MKGEQKERWRQLCEKVAEERDPVHFSALVAELLQELKNKDERLSHPPRGTAAGAGPSSNEIQKREA